MSDSIENIVFATLTQIQSPHANNYRKIADAVTQKLKQKKIEPIDSRQWLKLAYLEHNCLNQFVAPIRFTETICSSNIPQWNSFTVNKINEILSSNKTCSQLQLFHKSQKYTKITTDMMSDAFVQLVMSHWSMNPRIVEEPHFTNWNLLWGSPTQSLQYLNNLLHTFVKLINPKFVLFICDKLEDFASFPTTMYMLQCDTLNTNCDHSTYCGNDNDSAPVCTAQEIKKSYSKCTGPFVIIKNEETNEYHCIIPLQLDVRIQGQNMNFIQSIACTARIIDNIEVESLVPFMIECAVLKIMLQYGIHLACRVHTCQNNISCNTAAFLHYSFGFKRCFSFDILKITSNILWFSPKYIRKKLCETIYWNMLKSKMMNEPNRLIDIDISCGDRLVPPEQEIYLLGLMIIDGKVNDQVVHNINYICNVMTQVIVRGGLLKGEDEDTMPEDNFNMK